MISPTDAIASIPPGPWAVGVSGGADSTALLCLLRTRPELSLHVVHLDHELRGQASADDAEFVRSLADQFGVPCTLTLRSQFEAASSNLPQNPSAQYRALRMELYRRVAGEQHLLGVILAHHADDQAETVLHRLIRGSGPAGLCGMSVTTRINSLLVLRPLLNVRRELLREYLRSIGQSWREDASNESDLYLRNRLRRWLQNQPDLRDALLRLAEACAALRDWTSRNSPQLPQSFRIAALQSLPRLLARESARRWLTSQGANGDELTPSALDRLLEMACDAASPPRQSFPGELLALRRGGRIQAAP